jgi:predicted AlkP superfamily phosphohydrolase/phosphomutase
MPPQLLAIVMHGAGPYYLEPLFAADRLPNLQRLAAEGHRRYFRSELPIAAGAWVTLLTGLPVAAHGTIDYVDRDARSYDGLRGCYASSRDYADLTIQSILSAAGRRVASIYLPMTVPPWPVNGMIISGFPLVDERRPPTYPPELAATLPPFSADRLLSLRYGDTARIGAYLRQNLTRIEEVSSDAVREGGFDVVLACLPTPDLAHHYFWRPDDPTALERISFFYEEIDRVIGRLVGLTGDRTTVVVLSDHGGRAAPRKLFGVNRWLAETGFLVTRSAGIASRAAVSLTNCTVDWAKRHRINHAIAPRLRGELRHRVSRLAHNMAFVDWSRSRAYGLDFFCPLAGIEVNLRGRQAEGCVPAADYEPLRDELVAALEGLVEPDTGHRVFDRVCRRETLFDGPHVDRFPDVIGVLDEQFDVRGRLELPVIGANRGQDDYPFMGYHSQEAFFCARGPGIPTGRGSAGGGMPSIAPTLLALMGLEPPASMLEGPFEWSGDRD